jgi:dTDP-4-amino-4,6-dideoxygalactose transaminase
MPYYRDTLGVPQDDCPNADDYYAGAISLPMFPGLTDADVQRVAARLQGLLS